MMCVVAGVRGGRGRGPGDAQAALGDRAGRLQRLAAGRDRPLVPPTVGTGQAFGNKKRGSAREDFVAVLPLVLVATPSYKLACH